MKFIFSRCKNRSLNKVPRTYSIKPLVKSGIFCIFSELAILEYFKKKGYDGFWVDAFHKKYWLNINKKCSFGEMEDSHQKIIEKIKSLNNGKISGCWDLIIWKGNKIKFIESKGRPCNDKIRENQIDFKNRLIGAKFKEKDFIMAEWDYS